MKLPALITTDLHLTEAPDTEYRWGLFPWINQQIEDRGIESVRILGDLTDAKDNHSAGLTNRIADALRSLKIDDLALIAGNHDWLKRGHEFFRFLNHIPGVRFITSPTEDSSGDRTVMYLPYSKNPAEDWSAFKTWEMIDFVFMHQTVTGAVASNGQEMEGEAVPEIKGPKVYSGDIHVPQTIKGVTYIGSPYHVHFGDSFAPRVLLLDRKGREHWLHYPSPKRVMAKVTGLAGLKRMDLAAGDMVKVVVTLAPDERHEWARIRRSCLEYLTDREIQVFGIAMRGQESAKRLRGTSPLTQPQKSPYGVIFDYCQRFELGGDAFDAAMDILES